MTEIDAATDTSILWANLTCDATSPRFLDQKVSVGTEECPQGSRARDDLWVFHRAICTKHQLRHRVIDFDIAIGKKSLLDPEYVGLLLWSKRYMLALLSHPAERRGMRHLASARNEFFFVKALITFIAEKCGTTRKPILSSLSGDEAAAFATSISAGWKTKNSFDQLELFIGRIQSYGGDGLTGDRLSPEAFRAIMRICMTSAPRQHWSQEPAEKKAVDDVAYPPLPDEYCRRVLEIAHYYRRELADHLIAHAKKYMQLFMKNEHAIRYSAWAQSYVWPVSELPFAHDYAFPPTNWRHTSLLITIMQMANANEVLLFTGARNSEFLLMNQKCLVFEGEGDCSVRSIRFKNVASLGGASVDWPVPDCVADAVTTQIKLAKAVGASSALWLAPRNLTQPLADNLTHMLQRFAEFHKLDPANGVATTVNAQRFRSTIARLIYLGNGADIRRVKRVLGHRSVNTTIKYVQMSPFIQEEMNLNLYPASDDQPASAGPVCAELDLKPKTLSALLLALNHQGRRLHAIGPGVFVTAEDSVTQEEIAAIDPLAALSFLVECATKPAMRNDGRIIDWLSYEGQRICAGAQVAYRPPSNRHLIAYERIMQGSHHT